MASKRGLKSWAMATMPDRHAQASRSTGSSEMFSGPTMASKAWYCSLVSAMSRRPLDRFVQDLDDVIDLEVATLPTKVVDAVRTGGDERFRPVSIPPRSNARPPSRLRIGVGLPHPSPGAATPGIFLDAVHLHQLQSRDALEQVAGRLVDAVGAAPQNARRVVHPNVPLALHALPVRSTARSGGQGGRDRGRSRSYRPASVGFSLPCATSSARFSVMCDLDPQSRPNLGIEHLVVLVAVGATGDQLVGAGFPEPGDVNFGLLEGGICVAHLVRATAAAQLPPWRHPTSRPAFFEERDRGRRRCRRRRRCWQGSRRDRRRRLFVRVVLDLEALVPLARLPRTR